MILRVVLLSVFLSVGFSFACSHWANSDGRSAVALNLLNLTLFVFYTTKTREKALGCLLAAAGVFGLVELLADFLCVRCTRTLDYALAHSTMVLESPWWMPLSWALVAVQVGVLGDYGVHRFGLLKGALLTGILGALLIPFYEEMAWGAHWWRYKDCLMLGHTPVYIIVAEAVIGSGLALMGHFALRARSLKNAALIGAAAGLVTIFGGMLGWGLVEFLGRGAVPKWPSSPGPSSR
ncbi:DUF6989 domain-containing protein [Armatimonas sp.]|uniref:DUF6989 domain-containing protein n=1 Tax=Armatimonas sp. TaxID=1872638 RepID=UPI0037521C85